MDLWGLCYPVKWICVNVLCQVKYSEASHSGIYRMPPKWSHVPRALQQFSSLPGQRQGNGANQEASLLQHSSAASTLPVPRCPLGPAGPLCPVLWPASMSIVPGGIQQQLQAFLEASLTEEERARLLEGVIKGPWLWFVRGQECASPGWALQSCKPAAPHGCDSATVLQETRAI